MLPDLSEIKAKRKQHGLTQSELAALSGVSQSLIAKLESGNIVPSYDKAKRLFDCLERLKEESAITAKELMTKKVVYVSENDGVKKAVKLMEEKALSQLPVLSKGKSVGLISEKSVVAKLGSGNIDVAKIVVKEVMDDSPPMIQVGTPFKSIAQLLNHCQAVLVARKGKIRGIITKSDLLKSMLLKP